MAASKDTSTAILIRVDQSGGGDFRKIQEAIDAVPSNNSELVFIWIKPGTYRYVVELIFDFVGYYYWTFEIPIIFFKIRILYIYVMIQQREDSCGC